MRHVRSLVTLWVVVLLLSCRSPDARLSQDDFNNIESATREIVQMREWALAHPDEKIKFSVVQVEKDGAMQDSLELKDAGSQDLSDWYERLKALRASLYASYSDDFCKAIADELTKQLTVPVAREFTAAISEPIYIAGDEETFTPLQVLGENLEPLRDDLTRLTLSAEKTTAHLQNVRFTPAEVQWEPLTEMHYVLSHQSEINVIVSHILNQPEIVKTLFKNLPEDTKQFWVHNTNSITGASRNEPYDVLLSNIKHSITKDFNYSNPVEIGYAIEPLLKYVLGLGDTPTQNFLAFRSSDYFSTEVLLICLSTGPMSVKKERRFSSEQKSLTDESSGVKVQTVESIDIRSGEKLEISCAGKSYTIQGKIESAPKIPKPDRLSIEKDVKAVASLALVSEMNPTVLFGGIAYLLTYGYVLKSMTNIDDLKADFSKEASSAHVVIPIGHAFSANQTMLGVSSAIKLQFKRYTGSPSKRKAIDFVLYLPPMSNGDGKKEILNKSDIANMICQHDQCMVNQSQIVLNNSCYSDGTINSWMTQYIMLAKK